MRAGFAYSRTNDPEAGLAQARLPFGLLTLADDQITKVAFAVCLATPLGQGGLAAMAVTLATCLFLATRHRAQEPPVRPAIREQRAGSSRLRLGTRIR